VSSLVEVTGTEINEVHDASGKITISIWTASAGTGEFHDFQVNVGTDWVCIGGGATGSKYQHIPGQGSSFDAIIGGHYLTASFPSVDSNGQEDFKGWRIISKDHLVYSLSPLIGFAIGMKHGDLTREELKSNLKMFPEVSVNAVHHPELRGYLDQGFLLLGGGFRVLDQLPGGGNLATASFPDSTISWKVRSQDVEIDNPSNLKVIAIGIRESLTKPNSTAPPIGNIVTTFSSFEFLNYPGSKGSFSPTSVAKPLPEFALCGGGGATHPGTIGAYIYSLEPTALANSVIPPATAPTVRILDPSEQTFTARSTSKYESHVNTAYAMGIKFQPATAVPGPGPGPAPTECNKEQTLSLDAVASGQQSPGVDALKAVDGSLTTRWVSPIPGTQDPWIIVWIASTDPLPLCRVDIAWADGNSHPYKFSVDVSVDQTTWTNVLSSQQSSGTSNDFEPYTFQPIIAKFVRITITDSVPGIAFPIAQISEIKVYGDS
jgi:hypothetical protein